MNHADHTWDQCPDLNRPKASDPADRVTLQIVDYEQRLRRLASRVVRAQSRGREPSADDLATIAYLKELIAAAKAGRPASRGFRPGDAS